MIWLRIVVAFNPGDGDEKHWEIVERARRATEPRISNSQVDYPQEVAQLRQASLQLEGIKALAKKMNSKEAKEAVGALSMPQPAQLAPAPEIGWLPAPSKDAYAVLESSTEGR